MGRTKVIKNDVFDVPDGGSLEQLNKTSESIDDYLNDYNQGMACSQFIHNMNLELLEDPDRPDDFSDPVSKGGKSSMTQS
jgi:hypothetical protein